MKTLLKSLNQLISLKRNAKMLPNNIYLICSEAVASNLYFETKKDVEYAHEILLRHIPNIGVIIDYQFTPTGWLIIIKTNSKEKLISSFMNKHTKSKTLTRALLDNDYSKLISETIRVTISSISRQINRNNNRVGAIVKGNFNRFLFDSLDSVNQIISMMKNELIRISSQIKKYRPINSIWRKNLQLKKSNNLLSSKNHITNISDNKLIKINDKRINYVLRSICFPKGIRLTP